MSNKIDAFLDSVGKIAEEYNFEIVMNVQDKDNNSVVSLYGGSARDVIYLASDLQRKVHDAVSNAEKDRRG